jgi:hypothetical protein
VARRASPEATATPSGRGMRHHAAARRLWRSSAALSTTIAAMTYRVSVAVGCVLASTFVLGVPARARAEEPAGTLAPPVPPPELHPHRDFSLTISPIHLTLPVLELTGEARLADKVSVAMIVGVGKYSDTVNGVKLDASAFEVGGHFRYYVLGDFRHGMQLGAEVLYLHLADSQLVVKGEGVAIGPFVGYKYTADVGFTFDAQVGAEYVGARASSTTSSASETSWIPLLNLNVGWSF